MPTNLELLETSKTQLITQIANVTLNTKISYSIDGQSVSWTDYLRMLTDQVAKINQLIQIEGGAVELETQAWTW